MRKGIISFALALTFCVLSFPQGYGGKARVRGFVYDEDGNPLEGVRVKLFSVSGESGFDTVTDSEGSWIATWIRGGTWDIDFEKVGYEIKKIRVEISEIKKNPDIKIHLKKLKKIGLMEALKKELEEGNKLFDEKEYDKAIEFYKTILEKMPEAYSININIGNCYFEMERYDLAEQYYQKVLEKEPDNNKMKLVIGNCYANRGMDEKAVEWYNKIKLEEINDPAVLYNIGAYFYGVSKFTEALRYYSRAVGVKNDFLDAIYQMGLTHLALGQYREAIGVFENYLKHDADSDRASQVKGFIEFLKQKIEEDNTV